jgi:iron complex outermembrane receptor protein
VHGLFEPDAGLTEMLTGTGLDFTRGLYGFVIHKRANSYITIRGHANRRVTPLTSFELQRSAADIANTSIVTLTDFTQSIPEVTGGPCQDALVGNNRDTRQNAAQTCGISFHGMSSRNTAVTLNDEPLPMSGTSALYAGISHIAAATIERLQIYPDSPSLLSSGSPGGTVNFKLLSDFDGAETRLVYVPGLAGAVGEREFTQLMGLHWGDTKGLFLFDYVARDALAARARPLGTSDLRSLGGSDFRSPAGSPGTILLPEGTWAIPALLPGTRLTVQNLIAGQTNLYNTRLGTDLAPSEIHLSALLAGHRELDDGTRITCHSLLSWRRVRDATAAVADLVSVPSSNPFYLNPVGGTDPVVVEHGFLSDLGPTLLRDHVIDGSIACGATLLLNLNWQLRTSGSYSFEQLNERVSGLLDTEALTRRLADPNPASAFDVFQAGVTSPQTLQELNGSSLFKSISDIVHWRMLATGPVNSWLLGASQLTFGIELQRETLRSTEHALNVTPDTLTSLSRELAAAVVTGCVPFVNRSDSCGIEDPVTRNQVNLLAGGRYEHYNDGNHSLSPSVALRWRSPFGLTLEGGLARSVERGSLADLSDAHDTISIVNMLDPRFASSYSQVLVLYGGKSTLRPEEGNNLTFTARFEHPGPHAFTVAIHYFHDDLSGRIDAPVLGANSLQDPSIRELVTLSPTASNQALACQQGQYSQGLQACESAAIGAIVDDRLLNLSRLVSEGLDVSWTQELGAFLGDWSLRMDGTYLDRYVLHEPMARENLVNTMRYPLRFRALTELWWRHGIWSAHAFTNFRGSYRDITSAPAREIHSWTTVDLQMSATIPIRTIPAPKTLEVSATAHNLFNTNAPFANNPAGLGFDPSNADLLGQYFTVGFAVRF